MHQLATETSAHSSTTTLTEETEPPEREQNTYFELTSTMQTIAVQENYDFRQSVIFIKKAWTPAIGYKSKKFYRTYFPISTKKDWNNWQWQLQHRITRIEQLDRIISLTDQERLALTRADHHLPLAITPYYASLIAKMPPDYAIRRAVVPTAAEWIQLPGESLDPLAEDHDSPVPGIVHRYPDRVLFLTTHFCSVSCRYCTRSRVVNDHDCQMSGTTHWQQAIDYIRSRPEIRDVILSGGDPLTLGDDQLEWLLSEIKQIKHVEIIRIGTKIPIVLPQRITRSLLKILKKYHPLYISIHVMHPDELTMEVQEACNRLADIGIPLGSQTVLLKDINDSISTMTNLVHGLLKIRVKPYYLYQCDPIAGSSHFRTSVMKGLEIIQGLRGHTSGYAIPHYVIDAPGGGGKIPILPEYYLGRDGNDVLLRNYEGKTFRYPDPIENSPTMVCK